MSNSETKITVMTGNNVAVAIYNSHAEAEAAIKELHNSGFDLKKLDIIDRRSIRRCDRWGHQGDGLYCLEISTISVDRYEAALRINKFIVISRWTAEEVADGREVIDRTNPESVDEHQVSSACTEPDLRV